MIKFFCGKLVFVLFIYFSTGFSFLNATHIVGGDITYRCLGGEMYEISLTLRRDCINGQPNFDNPANVGIFDSRGVLQTQLGQSGRLRMLYNRDDTLNEFLQKNCGIIGGDVCVHTTTYRQTLRLPYLAGGYILAYQRCCRNYTINNILNPLSTGATYLVEISDEALRTCNSSPQLGPYPPIYVCGGQNINFDLEAFDADGDSLVYVMCDPYYGADTISPQPSFPSAPPYQPVDFKPPYSVIDMIGGIPPLNIGIHNGLMTGFAVNVIAQYLVGYCVYEYRDGKLLSVLHRDFQINVRICNSVPIADFDFEFDPCASPPQLKLTDKSRDLYTTIDSWNWLVELNGISYPSNNKNETFTLQDTGLATVRLVVLSSESCPDTIIKNIRIHSIKPVLNHSKDSICIGDSVQLVTSFDPSANFHWSPSAGLSCTDCPSPKAAPRMDTKYVVTTSFGNCSRTDTIEVDTKVCDSCLINVRIQCLPNGMIELTALDFKGDPVIPGLRKHELFWNIQPGANQNGYSITNKNPITVSSNVKFNVTSKIYVWRKGVPKTIEYADICTRSFSDETDLDCTGPCADIRFILSSCEDDYDVEHNLNFPTSICQSICSNACMYIVALFETDGTLIDPSKYKIKWSTGGTGAYVMMMGPYYNMLTVEVQKGDCNWFGRYWKSCKNYPQNLKEELDDNDFSITEITGRSKIYEILEDESSVAIYNAEGRLISTNKNQIEHLLPGLYFLAINSPGKQRIYKYVRR
jgi:hypothetical protein